MDNIRYGHRIMKIIGVRQTEERIQSNSFMLFFFPSGERNVEFTFISPLQTIFTVSQSLNSLSHFSFSEGGSSIWPLA